MTTHEFGRLALPGLCCLTACCQFPSCWLGQSRVAARPVAARLAGAGIAPWQWAALKGHAAQSRQGEASGQGSHQNLLTHRIIAVQEGQGRRNHMEHADTYIRARIVCILMNASVSSALQPAPSRASSRVHASYSSSCMVPPLASFKASRCMRYMRVLTARQALRASATLWGHSAGTSGSLKHPRCGGSSVTSSLHPQFGLQHVPAMQPTATCQLLQRRASQLQAASFYKFATRELHCIVCRWPLHKGCTLETLATCKG